MAAVKHSVAQFDIQNFKHNSLFSSEINFRKMSAQKKHLRFK